MSVVNTLIKSNKFDALKANEQLTLSIQSGEFPAGFNEGEIEFAPTYKIKNNSDEYSTKRIPGWCDRILYKSKNNVLTQHSYDSVNTIKTSDHRAVFSQFELAFEYEKENVDKHDLIDLKQFMSTKVQDEIKELVKSSKIKNKNLGKNTSKACIIF